MSKLFRLPLNLQFFADKSGDGEEDVKDTDKNKDQQGDNGANTSEGSDNKTPTLEELLKNEEFAKQFQSIVDKRVTDAVKKTEKKLREQAEEEKRKAQMTEEEKRAEELKRIEQERKEKEIALRIRELKLELIDILEQEELDTGFRELIDVSTVLHMEDAEEAKAALVDKVRKVKNTFRALVEKEVEAVKKEYLRGKSPDNLGKDGNNTPPDEYEKAKKAGDVKAMLANKFKGRE